MQINPVESWTRPDGEEVHFRSLCVGDSTEQFFGVTLWAQRTLWLADDGQSDRFQIGDVVVFDNMKIRSFTRKRQERISATTAYNSSAALLFRFDTTSQGYVEVMKPTPPALLTPGRDTARWASEDAFLVANRAAIRRSLEAMSMPLPRRSGRSTIAEVLAGSTDELVSLL
jgi:hypothetical protein